MTARDETRKKANRYSFYQTIILLTLALAAGRIAVVSSKEGDTAFLSANDRSRWCTVAALVEHGTYAIDKQVKITDPIKEHRKPWNTIDKVKHVGKDGKQHAYSSKPPLFPTMIAVLYKVVNLCTGMTLTEQPIYLARIILALVNLPILAAFCVATVFSIERVCRSDWARFTCAFATCFGTMLLPFSISLNNHLPAAAATAVVMWLYLYAAERLDSSFDGATGPVRWWVWLAAGLCAAFAAANELPALSMTVFWFLLFAWLDRGSAIPFVGGVAIVALGFFGTNWLAHESLRPPYAHRGNGPEIAILDSQASKPDMDLAKQVREKLDAKSLVSKDTELEVRSSEDEGRWKIAAGGQRFALCLESGRWILREWDDWYEYEESYWTNDRRAGVDRGEPSRFIYLFQMTVGHYGVFSLTPIWLLMPIGLITGMRFGPPDFRRLALAVTVATVVCLLFYLARPLIDRNYGGVSVCFRWLLWFTPLWLLLIGPVMETFCQTRRRRNLVMLMLAVSVFSVSTALSSPWQSPWIYQFWQFLGWISP